MFQHMLIYQFIFTVTTIMLAKIITKLTDPDSVVTRGWGGGDVRGGGVKMLVTVQ